MDQNAGRTVREILERKQMSVVRAPLPPGSPAWEDIMEVTWEEIDRRARRREPGYSTIRKMLSDRRFDK